jgi:hypothetical protein
VDLAEWLGYRFGMATTDARRAAAARSVAAWLSMLASRFEAPLLALAAAAPYAPGAWRFIRRGVPDVLFTGDAGTLELRVLHASHGTQLLGAYSRYQWSHPGPAFFYLALPFYELFREHGPALNLFAFVSNLASAVGIVFSARKLRGQAFALVTAALLAVYECIDPPFALSSEWNPLTPIVPIALFSLLCARIGTGELGLLPLFAFLGSAAIQTHVAFTPLVLSLSALAAASWGLRRRFGDALPSRRREGPSTARTAHVLGWTAGVLLLVWMPPLVENATSPEGNLTRILRFFTAPYRPEHTWAVAIDAVAAKLAALPISIVELVGPVPHPSSSTLLAIALGEVAAIAAALAVGLLRKDGAVVVLSAIAFTEIAAAVVAVHAIRGEIWPHLVIWVTIVGWMACVAAAAGVVALTRQLARYEATKVTCALLLLAVFARCLRREGESSEVFRARQPNVEKLANDVWGYLDSERVDSPVVRVATGDEWPNAVAVVLQLFKHHVPIYVERSELFLTGTEFAEKSSGHLQLLIGDRAFFESVHERPDVRLVTAAGDHFAFLLDPGYFDAHRIAQPPRLVAATGVIGDPGRSVDGVIPPQGTRWDSPLSVILESTESAITVGVPEGGVDGVFLSADGSDTYAILCGSEEGTSPLGGILAGVPIGMGTGLLVSPKLRSCRTVTVKPAHGDGYYSVGEIGFLSRK